MRLDLRDIIHVPGAQRAFSDTLDLSQVVLYGEKPFQHPISLSGHVRNRAGALQLEGTADTVLETRCARCLKPLSLPLHVPVTTLLAETLAEDTDEIVLLHDGAVDLEEVFAPACLLALDSRHLCSPACKGLCPTCGADLNDGPCNCPKTQRDPRLAVLAELLDPEEVSNHGSPKK